MAEWLRRGLQILARRFDSGSGLHTFIRLHRESLIFASEGTGLLQSVSASFALRLLRLMGEVCFLVGFAKLLGGNSCYVEGWLVSANA